MLFVTEGLLIRNWIAITGKNESMGTLTNLKIDLTGKKDYTPKEAKFTHKEVISYIEKMPISDELKIKLIKRVLKYPEGSLSYFLENIQNSIVR